MSEYNFSRSEIGGDVNIGNNIFVQVQGDLSIDQSLVKCSLEYLKLAPLTTVPTPAPHLIAAGSFLPFGPNSLFGERDRELLDLACRVFGTEAGAVVEAAGVSGLGGLGKTQLAAEFAYRWGPWFKGGVFWLDASDSSRAYSVLAAAGRNGPLGLPAQFNQLGTADQASWMRRLFSSPLPRLLILDNCEDEFAFKALRPTTGGCHLIVTSRRAVWAPGCGLAIQPLEPLLDGDGAKLLARYRPDLDGALALKEVCRELGGLPLALHLAGSFLARYRYGPHATPEAYLAALRTETPTQHASMESGIPTPTDHDPSVGRTFAISWNRLASESGTVGDSAMRIARTIAYLAPGLPVGRAVVSDSTELRDKLFEDAVHRLLELGLITQTANGDIAMHRLLSGWLCSINAPDIALVEAAANSLRGALRIATTSEHPALGRPCLPHAMWLIDQLWLPLGSRAKLAAHVTVQERLEGRFERALAVCERFSREALDRDDRILLDSARASTLREIGRPAEALKLLAETEKLIQRYGHFVEPSERAGLLHSRGMMLRESGDATAALKALKASAEIFAATEGKQSEAYATVLNSIGVAQSDLGQTKQACHSISKALNISRAILGVDHPNVAVREANLAGILEDLKEFGQARALIDHSLQITRLSLGQDHPLMVLRLKILARIQKHQEGYGPAATTLRQALEIAHRSLPGTHPFIGGCHLELGSLLLDLGWVDEACEHAESATKLIGANTPDHWALRKAIELHEVCQEIIKAQSRGTTSGRFR